MSRRLCVLVSGGMDSCALVSDLLRRGWEVHPLYVRCGLPWERAEIHWLRRYLRAVAQARLKPLVVARAPLAPWSLPRWVAGAGRAPRAGSAWDSVFLPGRNLLLLTQAAMLCRERRLTVVAIGTLRGNPFADARELFRRRLAAAIRTGLGMPFRVWAPYGRSGKRRLRACLPGAPLHLSFSCLGPRGLRPCGACTKCEERAMAEAR